MERMTKGEGMTPEEYIAMVEEEKKIGMVLGDMR